MAKATKKKATKKVTKATATTKKKGKVGRPKKNA